MRMDISGLKPLGNAQEDDGEGAAEGERKEESARRASDFWCAATLSSRSYIMVSGERVRDFVSIFWDVAGTGVC